MKDLTTQLKNLVQDRKNILLLTHHKMDGDGLSAMLVLKKFLEAQGKEVTAYSGQEVPEMYHFLPYAYELSSFLRGSDDFIISLESDTAEVDKIRYTVDGNKLNIVVTPKTGTFTSDDVSSKQAQGKYDLIVVLDSGDLEHLGDFYANNTEMFYSTPIVNIDHHITNTGYGQLNIVDVTAASTTEIIYRIIQNYGEDSSNFFDEDIATLLLTGLVVDTGSFQHTNTSPKALEFAADLIEMGARQQEIIQNIYKTKQLSTLKLWGRVLAKIQEDPIRRIVWSTVTKEDLIETGATLEAADGLIDELMTNAPGAEIIALIKDSLDNEMSVSLRSTNIAIDTLNIAQNFGGGGHKQASGFTQKGNNFNLFTAEVIKFIEQSQQERLGLSDEDIEIMREELKQQQQQLEKKSSQMNLELESSQTQKRDILSEMIEGEQGDLLRKKQADSKKKESEKKQQEVKKPEQNLEKKEEKKNQNAPKKPAQENDKRQSRQGEQKKNNDNKKGGKNNRNKREQNNKNQKQESKKPEQKSVNDKKENIQATPKKEEVKTVPKVQSEPVVEEVKPVVEKPQEKVDTNPEPQKEEIKNEPVAQEAPQTVTEAPVEQASVQQEQAQPVTQQVEQATPAQEAQATKEQYAQYASYYAQQLQQMDPSSQEYAQIYQYYQYYAQLAV